MSIMAETKKYIATIDPIAFLYLALNLQRKQYSMDKKVIY